MPGTTIEQLVSSVLNGAVRPSWSWTAVDGVQRSRPVFFKVALRPTAKDRFPRRPQQSAKE